MRLGLGYRGTLQEVYAELKSDLTAAVRGAGADDAQIERAGKFLFESSEPLMNRLGGLKTSGIAEIETVAAAALPELARLTLLEPWAKFMPMPDGAALAAFEQRAVSLHHAVGLVQEAAAAFAPRDSLRRAA